MCFQIHIPIRGHTSRSLIGTTVSLLACAFLALACKKAGPASIDGFEGPNILWLVAEDLSPHLPSFGDSTVATPHLSRLAAEGVRYPNFFSPSGVCAPSRAAIALGMYPTRTGAMHMRTGPWYAANPDPPEFWGDQRRVYEALPPAGTHMHSTYLRGAGYYTTNNAKQDYQFRAELTAWDESSASAHWRNRPDPGQPFFSIFNFGPYKSQRFLLFRLLGYVTVIF